MSPEHPNKKPLIPHHSADWVMCEGSDDASRHPRVYYHCEPGHVVLCRYCGHRFDADSLNKDVL